MEPGRSYPPPMWLVVTINIMVVVAAVMAMAFSVWLVVR